MNVQQAETLILKRTIKVLLAAGYTLGVNDGEETTIKHSIDHTAILNALRTTDEDRLLVYSDDLKKAGWVFFVYGNSGWDVICDYTTNLEPAMAFVNAYVDGIEGRMSN